MFNFFKKKSAEPTKPRITINDVQIPDLGWELAESNEQVKVWVNYEKGIAFSINFFDIPPDLMKTNDIDTHRMLMRSNIAQAKGGVLVLDFNEVNSIITLLKGLKIPMEPGGMQYVWSYTIPFVSCSFVLKITSQEIGTTGMREAVIVSDLMSSGEKKITKEGIEGWFEDPYAPEFSEGTPMNMAEQEKYDERFPDHPLSLAREMMKQIKSTVTFSKSLYDLEPFFNTK